MTEYVKVEKKVLEEILGEINELKRLVSERGLSLSGKIEDQK